MTLKSVKTRSNETVQVSSVSSNPTHKQNQPMDQTCRMFGSFIRYSVLTCVILSITPHTLWDVRFTQWWISRLQTSGMLHCVGWLIWRNLFPLSSEQMMEGVVSFKMLVLTCQTKWHHISDHHMNMPYERAEHSWWTYC